MLNYNIDEFQNNFSSVMDKVSQGKSVVIEKAGNPIAKIIPVVATTRKKRSVGFMKEPAIIPDDFDTMGAKEIEEMFYGKD